MNIPGKVENGVVVLEPGAKLPEGARVTVSCDDASFDKASDQWTAEKNRRRIELIDKEVAGTITSEEAAELSRLQEQAEQHVDAMHPLPVECAVRFM